MEKNHPFARTGRIGAALAAAVAVLLFGATGASAAEIHVLSAGAAKVAVGELAEAFRAHTGDDPVLSFATVGAITDQLAAGEAPDVVIVTREVAEQLEREGRVVRGIKIDIGQARIGVAVREGVAAPDVSTPDALKKALRGAHSIAYLDPATGSTSGARFARLLEDLGLAEQMKAKTRLIPGGSVAEVVATGDAELGIQEIPELVGVPGVRLAGPLPDALEKLTTYTGCIVLHTPVPQEATRFLRFLAGPAGRTRFAAAGFTLPTPR